MIDESGGAQQGQDIEINILMLYREFGTNSSLYFNYYLLFFFSEWQSRDMGNLFMAGQKEKRRKKKDIK